jgi:2-dehydropantoate 2-reductase
VSHVIVGAGAVGIGVGTALLAAGEPVVFVARGARSRALRDHGCARTGLFGDASFPGSALAVTDTLDAVAQAPSSILLATKAFATEEVARSLAARPLLVRGDAPIVSLQNGLGNAEVLAAALDSQRVFSASILIGFRRTAESRVDVTVCAKPMQIGSLYRADLSPVAALVRSLALGGIPTETNDDIAGELWSKALYNCALNPLGAILRVPYGALGRSAETRSLMERVVREIFDVMHASGEHTHWGDAERYLEHFYRDLLPPTAEHESSMLQDVRAGRRTEIDALCGEIVRRGSAAGVDTPVNRALHQLIRAIEANGMAT